MRRDLILRALLPAAALLALALDAPRPVTGGLALAGLVAVASRLARSRGPGVADRALVTTGGVLVVLVLIGMLLGSTALGLGTSSWVVALVVLSGAGLVVAGVLPARTTEIGRADPRTRRRVLLLLPWTALAAVVVVLSVRMTGASLAESDSPPLELSLGRVSGNEVQVVVSSQDAIGPLEVRASDAGSQISYPLVSVPARGSVTTTLALPPSGRFVITLSYPDQTTALRTLILDR